MNIFIGMCIRRAENAVLRSIGMRKLSSARIKAAPHPHRSAWFSVRPDPIRFDGGESAGLQVSLKLRGLIGPLFFQLFLELGIQFGVPLREVHPSL